MDKASRVRAFLEVERKFRPDIDFARRLQANSGTPQFRSIRHLGNSTFEDVYFDRNSVLLSQNVWLRSRNGAWEAKIRQGGDFTNSQFKELDRLEDIHSLLSTYLGRECLEKNTFGLLEAARFTTSRQAWLLNERFKVVVDDMDFGHRVGEVELQIPWPGTEKGRSEYPKQKLDFEIKDFMGIHSWIFPQGNPLGKLPAYMAHAQKKWP